MKTPENRPATIEPIAEVDMSPPAIDRRLRRVSQLYKLGMAIRKARSKPSHAAEMQNDLPDQQSSPEVSQ